MNGALIATAGQGATGLDRYRTFVTRNMVTGFRDQVAGPISVWFVVFELFVSGVRRAVAHRSGVRDCGRGRCSSRS